MTGLAGYVTDGHVTDVYMADGHVTGCCHSPPYSGVGVCVPRAAREARCFLALVVCEPRCISDASRLSRIHLSYLGYTSDISRRVSRDASRVWV